MRSAVPTVLMSFRPAGTRHMMLCNTVPFRAEPCRAVPCRAGPCRARGPGWVVLGRAHTRCRANAVACPTGPGAPMPKPPPMLYRADAAPRQDEQGRAAPAPTPIQYGAAGDMAGLCRLGRQRPCTTVPMTCRARPCPCHELAHTVPRYAGPRPTGPV